MLSVLLKFSPLVSEQVHGCVSSNIRATCEMSSKKIIIQNELTADTDFRERDTAGIVSEKLNCHTKSFSPRKCHVS